jgi:hypothetical protein
MNDLDRDKMLKDMAANRGCKLVKSRRRKAGSGDFGRYGLQDAGSGREVFGFGAQGLLTASARRSPERRQSREPSRKASRQRHPPSPG